MSFRILGFKRWSKNNVPIMTHFSPLAVDSSTSLHTFMSEPRNRNFNNIFHAIGMTAIQWLSKVKCGEYI